MIRPYVTTPYDHINNLKQYGSDAATNLWASIDEENSRVLPARLQVVRLVYHSIKLEARLPGKVKNLRWAVISRTTWTTITRSHWLETCNRGLESNES